eukprot:TRINITY_DN16287_c0_g1_i1.p1 TRINITY_DN16287_c0_g1~~TRINITY_DN16287_c0_g1_i1.p1  ORF type:complete len:268 (-),score=21.70 TRINITY_DN16287_c0_g1_i1:268-1071(-)
MDKSPSYVPTPEDMPPPVSAPPMPVSAVESPSGVCPPPQAGRPLGMSQHIHQAPHGYHAMPTQHPNYQSTAPADPTGRGQHGDFSGGDAGRSSGWGAATNANNAQQRPQHPPRYFIVSEERYRQPGCCCVLGNILWIVLFGGIIMALLWLLFALIFAITIVGLPCAKQCVKLARLSFLPFGQDVRNTECGCTSGRGCVRLLGNLLWFPFGILTACGHFFFAIVCFITICFIPFGLQHLKLAGLALCPFGSDLDGTDKRTTVEFVPAV